MMHSKLIAVLGGAVAILFGVGAGLLLLRPDSMPLPAIGQLPWAEQSLPDVAGTPKAPTTPEASATDSVAAAPRPDEQTTGAVGPGDTLAAAPSFDVVRTEPSGEGVIAGRAEPGWTVKVESAGTQVAEVKADEQGEWTVVLDAPLPAGEHVLSLKAISPDAARAVASKQTVPVAVAGPVKKSVPVAALAPRPRGALPTAQGAAPGIAPRAARPGEVAPSTARTLPQTAAVDESNEAAPGLLSEQLKPGTYTIQRGDTLWAIAERYLGAGWRYTSIFRDNRTSIKNPNLIHPEQNVSLPEE